jgi:hypothetical protein
MLPQHRIQRANRVLDLTPYHKSVPLASIKTVKAKGYAIHVPKGDLVPR